MSCSNLTTRRRHLLALATLLAGPVSMSSVWAWTHRPTALLIGNGAYPQAPLRNAAADARLMARTLGGLGYEVQLAEDARLTTMSQSIQNWLARSTQAPVRIFFFAGHGVQIRGRNYLLPVDTRPSSAEDIDRQSVLAQELVDRLARFDAGANLLILDACRNAPGWLLPSGLPGRAAGSGPEPGLAAVSAPRGTLVAYSTAPGAVAMDGGWDGNSLYTRHLSTEMQRGAALPIEVLFKRVRTAVLQESQSSQIPWESSSLVGDFCLQPDAAGRCGMEGSATNPPSPPAGPSAGSAIDLRRLRP